MAAVEKLSAQRVARMVAPGRYGDGGGLWLQVRGPDQRSWIFRYTRGGRARWAGLGDLATLSLAEARKAARRCRQMILEGQDPIDARRAQRAEALASTAIPFQDVADRYIAAHAAGWRSDKHAAQWTATLTSYAYPVIGKLSVAAVDTGHVTRILEPLWKDKTETASRVRGRIEAVLDYAKARGWRTGENPARWRGHLDNLLPARAKVQRVEHHAALPWRETGGFMAELAGQQGMAALALRFAILTAARSGEVRGATWGEIDLAGATWTVPGERMKAGREHRVPLSDAALALLREVAPLANGNAAALAFPGAKAGKPLSDMSLTAVLRRMGRGDLTAHGFRSTFRDWCAEGTNYRREVAEAALAHTLRDKVEAAYQRGDLFDKRARLMAAWSEFCANPAPAGGDVVPLRKAEAA